MKQIVSWCWMCVFITGLSVVHAGALDLGVNPVELEVARLSTGGDVLQWVKSQSSANEQGEFQATVALNVGTPDKPQYQIVTISAVSVKSQTVLHFTVKDTRVSLKGVDREELPVLYQASFPMTKEGTYLLYESWNEQLRVTVKPKPRI